VTAGTFTQKWTKMGQNKHCAQVELPLQKNICCCCISHQVQVKNAAMAQNISEQL
jgi:hypothetical protein